MVLLTGEYGSGQRSPHYHQSVPFRAPVKSAPYLLFTLSSSSRPSKSPFKLDGSWAAEHERRPFRSSEHDISLGCLFYAHVHGYTPYRRGRLLEGYSIGSPTALDDLLYLNPFIGCAAYELISSPWIVHFHIPLHACGGYSWILPSPATVAAISFIIPAIDT
jgi:hypothetical protein